MMSEAELKAKLTGFPPLPPGLGGGGERVARLRGKGKGGTPLNATGHRPAREEGGKLAKAEAIALSAARSQLGRDLVQKGFYADSSRKSRNAIRSTTYQLLHLAFPLVAPLPMTSEKVETLAAVLKGAGYRSGGSYLAEYKLLHLEHGFEVGGPLNRKLAQCKRACTRGVGPAKKALEVTKEARLDSRRAQAYRTLHTGRRRGEKVRWRRTSSGSQWSGCSGRSRSQP